MRSPARRPHRDVVRPEEADGPDAAVRDLVALAGAAGAPDNVACVVADVVAL
ncbi:hypothetical protein [Streptomyces sp. B1I3]|uniref:hypothetical protein n=1 Tax=Streptomyces sp. B1I3 TaxID=3042264 RepID=UPI0027816F98|nr:hypothetical protein [Streptomyces sp. B1I3]MDQ0795347.1 serine/threonine protein phosphatase PrpC [Streptomyces sp. B1I3]